MCLHSGMELEAEDHLSFVIHVIEFVEKYKIQNPCIHYDVTMVTQRVKQTFIYKFLPKDL